MEIPYCEGKQHQPQSSRITKDIANICNKNIILRIINHQLLQRQIRKITNPKERAKGTTIGLEITNERGDTLNQWETQIMYNIINTMFHEDKREMMDAENPLHKL